MNRWVNNKCLVGRYGLEKIGIAIAQRLPTKHVLQPRHGQPMPFQVIIIIVYSFVCLRPLRGFGPNTEIRLKGRL